MAKHLPYRNVPITLLGMATVFGVWASCSSDNSSLETTSKINQAIGLPPPNEQPLDPTTIAQFVNQLPILVSACWRPPTHSFGISNS